MAKAGFWMRGARGKLAGASFAKGQNGQTIQREIKTPRNPNTNPQLFQRAIMATIMRAYSAGKKVFDHAYEGISVGSKCQQKFMRDNLKTLRSKLFAEYSAGGSLVDMTARVIARGGIVPVANAYKISEGTLVNNILTATDGKSFKFAGADTVDLTVAGWLQQQGIVEDDIFTICAFLNAPEVVIGGIEGVEAAQYVSGTFAWVRLEVKPTAFTDNNLIADVNISDVFIVAENNSLNGFDGDDLLAGTIDASTWGNGYNAGAAACIRSRKNSILRSTETMVAFNENTHDFGIKAPYVTQAWTKGTNSLGDSSLLLEGGEVNGGTVPISFSGYIIQDDDDITFATIAEGTKCIVVESQHGAGKLVLAYADGSVPITTESVSDGHVGFPWSSVSHNFSQKLIRPALGADLDGLILIVSTEASGANAKINFDGGVSKEFEIDDNLVLIPEV